jgi:hypothetical protein
LNGHGIALLSHLVVADDISAGRLRVLMPECPPMRFPLTLVYPSRRNLPPRVRVVIDFLNEIIQANPATKDGTAVFDLADRKFLDARLELHGSPNRFDRARKLCQEPVAGVLHDATAMFGDCGLDTVR